MMQNKNADAYYETSGQKAMQWKLKEEAIYLSLSFPLFFIQKKFIKVGADSLFLPH